MTTSLLYISFCMTILQYIPIHHILFNITISNTVLSDFVLWFHLPKLITRFCTILLYALLFYTFLYYTILYNIEHCTILTYSMYNTIYYTLLSYAKTNNDMLCYITRYHTLLLFAVLYFMWCTFLQFNIS